MTYQLILPLEGISLPDEEKNMAQGARKSRKYIGHARRAIEEYELAELLAMSRPIERVYWLLGADCGLRHAEMTNLREHDLSPGRIRIRVGKGNISRWTLITPRTLSAMQECDFWRNERLRYRQLTSCWQRYRRHGIAPDLCIHSLRHRFATQLLRRGMSIFDVQSLMGHSRITTTVIYLHEDPARFDRAAAILEGRALDSVELSTEQIRKDINLLC